MIKVYAAANLQDAHIVAGLLRGNGIDVRILNASAHGGLGEIPFTQAYPEIWIVHAADLPRAEVLIASFEGPALVAAEIGCPACGEANPGDFAVCWNCGGALTAVEDSFRSDR